MIEGFVEDVATSTILPKADLCLCSGLLNEIENPLEILQTIRKTLKHDGLVHINVPNAFSLHRQLALEMGLIGSLHQFSPRNIELLQYHIFDRAGLIDLVNKAGFTLKDKMHFS